MPIVLTYGMSIFDDEAPMSLILNSRQWQRKPSNNIFLPACSQELLISQILFSNKVEKSLTEPPLHFRLEHTKLDPLYTLHFPITISSTSKNHIWFLINGLQCSLAVGTHTSQWAHNFLMSNTFMESFVPQSMV